MGSIMIGPAQRTSSRGMLANESIEEWMVSNDRLDHASRDVLAVKMLGDHKQTLQSERRFRLDV